MAPRFAQMDAARALDLLPYILKMALCVLVGGLKVVVVGVLHVDAGTLLNCAEQRKNTAKGLFSRYLVKKHAKYKKY